MIFEIYYTTPFFCLLKYTQDAERERSTKNKKRRLEMEPVIQLIQLTLRAEREMAARRRSIVARRDDRGDEKSTLPSKREQRIKGGALCRRQSCECA
jgi:hypothetical protein